MAQSVLAAPGLTWEYDRFVTVGVLKPDPDKPGNPQGRKAAALSRG